MLLGIDTGGTYTDAVLMDGKRDIIGAAKALTTRDNLSVGIQAAVDAVLPDPPPEIELVALSSTLATNAIVEGKGSPICLLLVGYDPRTIDGRSFGKLVADRHVVFIPGGHTVAGDEQCPLDIQMARKAILAHAPEVSAFGVSGYFGVRNPAHELRVKRMVRRLTNLPVTCGHELTTQLDAPLRAITVALNARLISLMQQLILQVRESLSARGIGASLMVVKGDGSLMDAKMALERPVETIMSGPAASVIGALQLCEERNGFIIDMGGTTTDVAAVDEGIPKVNRTGAKVAGWQTMVEAMDVHTIGLGGDSEVHADEGGNITVGPRRVIPLSLLAVTYPSVIQTLQRQLEGSPSTDDGRFVMRTRAREGDQEAATSTERHMWKRLSQEPLSLVDLLEGVNTPNYFRNSLEKLVERELVAASAFTPTDAVHVLGQYRASSMEAAELGARLWARRLGLDAIEFCRRVFGQVIVQAGHIVIESALAQEGGPSSTEQDGVGHLLISRALGYDDDGILGVRVSLKRPLIGVGAPAATYLTPLAERLGTELRVPANAEVANAVGAVAGSVVQTVRILVRRPAGVDNPYRVFSPSGVRDFPELEDAVAFAKSTAQRLARRRAHEAGADRVRVHTRRNDETLSLQNDQLHFGTEITATALGRPRLQKTPAP